MKPKIFIGSSVEGKGIADAIDSNLQYDAEPTVWTNGVFGLAEGTLRSLMKQVEESDFAAFVFSMDDVANMRDKSLGIPRDNVVYELGLFSGALTPERCFFLKPREGGIHIPTDLLGITSGSYANREDKVWASAVNPFCTDIRNKFSELGFRHRKVHEDLYELITKYGCTKWILDIDVRVRTKDDILTDMVHFCERNRVNKQSLAIGKTTGNFVAVAAAIINRQDNGDTDLLIDIVRQRDLLPRGHAQSAMLGAMLALKNAGKVSADQKSKLLDSISRFHNPDPSITDLTREFAK